MVTIFNRKELAVTFSVQELSKLRQVLKVNNIEYIIKTVDRNSPSPFTTGNRQRAGTFGQNMDISCEYILYVKKQDHEKAAFLIK